MGVFKNIVTLGGAHRLDKAHERFQRCQNQYHQVVGRLNAANANLESTIGRLKTAVGRTKRKLKLAHKILHPRCIYKAQPQYRNSLPVARNKTAMVVGAGRDRISASSTDLALLGVTSGTSAAIIAWQGVQILGIASTGTAIGGIYGAAASNAGWAAFGGGSLATGGGGMALGHLVLPGIGIVVAVGVSAVATHSKANEVNRMSDELDSATNTNEKTLTRVGFEVKQLQQAEGIYSVADDALQNAVQEAKHRLRRFGWLSVLYRYLRFKINGVYYTLEEMYYVQQLDRAVQDFMSTFGVQ